MAAKLQPQSENISDSACTLSFKDLAQALNAQESVPSLADLNALVERTRISANELQPYLGFKAGNYSRHRVMKNEFVEMLVLCWKPGQRTPIDVSGRDLVTIHVYAPPLGVLKTYKLGSSTIDLYTPADPDFL